MLRSNKRIQEMDNIPFFYFEQFNLGAESKVLVAQDEELDLEYPLPKIIGLRRQQGVHCFLFTLQRTEISNDGETPIACRYSSQDLNGNKMTMVIMLSDQEAIQLTRGYATDKVHDSWKKRNGL